MGMGKYSQLKTGWFSSRKLAIGGVEVKQGLVGLSLFGDLFHLQLSLGDDIFPG